jgi:hypothetical protein
MSATDLYEAVPEREPAWQVLDRATSHRKKLLAAGFLPLPVNGKAPPLPGWQDVRATPAVIDGWSSKYADAANTGILTLATPAVDIDVLDATVADEVQAIAESMLGVSAVRVGKAPKRAMLYRANTPFGKVATPIFNSPDGCTHKVEVLCNGQQIVVSGIHPETRAPYKWRGGEPGLELKRDALPSLNAEKAAEFIVAAAQCMAAHGWEPKKKTNGVASSTTRIDTSADASANTSERERRYAMAALDGCADEIAQAARGERNNILNKKAFRLGTMTARGWVSRAEVADALSSAADACGLNNDDGEESTRKTIESGLNGGEKVPHPDLVDFSKATDVAEPQWQAYESAPGRIHSNLKPKGESEWPEPKLLPSGLLPVQSFDLALLPATIAPWVADIAERMQCPPDFVGVPAVIGLGSVLGRRVGVRPQRRTDWLEVPNLWGCIVGRPGMMKSPAMAEALKPLHRLEANARKSNDEARRAYAANLEVYKLRQDAARAQAKKALENGADALGVLALQVPEVPKDRRYVTNDCTYEALGQILVDNPNGVLAFRDELVSLLKTLDREEQAAARGFFLSAWSGTNGYTFDRIIRGHKHIEAACVSLLGSTQPGRLAEYVRRTVSGGAGDDGFIQRFGLLVWPDGSPEWKNIDRYPDTVARQTAWATFERLDKLTADDIQANRDQFESTRFLRFDDEGQEIFDEWRMKLEGRLRSGDHHPALESHLTKYRKLVPALALIFSLADGGTGAIDGAAVLRALAFADYLESHARRCYAAGNEAETAAAKAILSRIRKGDLVDGFSCRDVHRRGWSNLSEPDQVQSGLNLLVDCDWLGAEQIAGGSAGGRPRTVYRTNPRAFQ